MKLFPGLEIERDGEINGVWDFRIGKRWRRTYRTKAYYKWRSGLEPARILRGAAARNHASEPIWSIPVSALGTNVTVTDCRCGPPGMSWADIQAAARRALPNE